MKGKRRMGIFFMLVCLLLGCQTVRAQEGSTAIAVTVPEQPEEEIESAAGAKILDDVPLPEGWEWEDGSISLKPGESVTGRAVYRDKGGSILAERQIIVAAPEEGNPKYDPVSGSESIWNGEEVGITVDGKELSRDASEGVKTGDEANAIGWGIVMILSMTFVIACAASARKQKPGK